MPYLKLIQCYFLCYFKSRDGRLLEEAHSSVNVPCVVGVYFETLHVLYVLFLRVNLRRGEFLATKCY